MNAVVSIPFGEWLPDRPEFNNPGCVVADNVLPTPGGYGPIRAPVEVNETLSGGVAGARQFFDGNNSSVIVGGTNTALFVRRSTITETSGMTAIGSEEAWDFAQFNSFVVATGVNNSPQYLTDIDSDSTWSALPGSPPQAKRCAKVGDFLMLGNIAGAPNRIQWGSFNNPTGSWAASRLTQAGSADLPLEFGGVQRIVGGRYATVFQRQGIMRLNYVGPPKVWNSSTVSESRGAVAPFGVVAIGYLTYFLAQDGFFVTNGASVQPIGSQKINNWFFENVNQAKIAEVQGAIDWQNECVFWAFHCQSTGNYDKAIIYSWAQQKWSTATLNAGWLVQSAVSGVTLEELDSLYSTLEAVPYSLDSAIFKDGDRRLGVFVGSGSNTKYADFSGDTLEATWETGEFQPAPGKRVFVSEVTPDVDADDWDFSVTLLTKGVRNQSGASATTVTGWGGFAPVRGEGQKMRIRVVKPSGNWADASGVQVRYRRAGGR